MFELHSSIEKADAELVDRLILDGILDQHVDERAAASKPAPGRTLVHIAIRAVKDHQASAASLQVLDRVLEQPVLVLEKGTDGRTALHQAIVVGGDGSMDINAHADLVTRVGEAMIAALVARRRKAFVDAAIASVVDKVVGDTAPAADGPQLDENGFVIHTPCVACGADTADEEYHEAAAILTILRSGAGHDGHETCVELALRLGTFVAIDRVLSRAFHDVCPHDSSVAVAKLTAGDLPAVPKNALHIAAAHGRVDALRYFASAASGFRSFAVEQPDADRVDKWTPLHAAAYHAQVDAVAELLRLGARAETTDSFSRTPLHVASEVVGGVNVMKLLLNSWDATSGSAPCEATCRLIAMRDRGGRTALDAALRQGVTANVQYLVAASRTAELSMNAAQTSTVALIAANQPDGDASRSIYHVSSIVATDMSRHLVDTSIAPPSAARSSIHSTEASRRVIFTASPATDREKLAAELRASMASCATASDLWRSHRNFVQRAPDHRVL